jgi:transcriptional regulator with XRE-family HTH domain
MKVDLKAIRDESGISRADIAKQMGMSATSGRITVAQIEGRQDWLLSTISAYVRANGGTAVLYVNVNGQELEFEV